MPRPGMLTRGRANRRIKTPGGRIKVHRRKYYKAGGICSISGKDLQLPQKSKAQQSRNTSKSSKRPNRPYGGMVSSKALRREITREVRE
ncbi:MAG: 50S ribosomal protein L34e [Candidatus Thorarchaeota archaeon]